MRAFYFDGVAGELIREEDIPERYLDEAKAKRLELIETLANIDPTIEELYLNESNITEE